MEKIMMLKQEIHVLKDEVGGNGNKIICSKTDSKEDERKLKELEKVVS